VVYLITGGTGLIGSRIARDLIKEGGEVIAYDLLPDIDIMQMVLSKDEMAQIKIIKGSVTDLDFLVRTTEENKVDIIFHMASILGTAITNDVCRATRINAEGTINVFETARRLGLRKVVWASTNAVFSGQYDGKHVPNDCPHHPWGLYGAFKSLAENVADFYFEKWSMDITAPRYGALIFGAGQQRGNSADIAQELIIKPALGKPSCVPWGDDTMGWLYVDDAARAAILSSKQPRIEAGAYNIDGEIHSVKEIASYVRELIPDADIDLLPGCLDGPPWRLDTTLIEKEVGYRSQWTTKEGLRETINMIRRQYGLSMI